MGWFIPHMASTVRRFKDNSSSWGKNLEKSSEKVPCRTGGLDIFYAVSISIFCCLYKSKFELMEK